MRVDAHWDTALFLREAATLENLPQAHADYKRLREQVDIAFMALFIHPETYPGTEAQEQEFSRLLGLLKADLAQAQGIQPLLRACQLQEPGKYALIGAEGGGFLGDTAELAEARLQAAFADGLRFLGLTWNPNNALAGGCGEGGGLTDLGYEVVARCNAKGILLDGAHLAPQSLLDLLQATTRPIAVSHTCCTALGPDWPQRNLNDRQLRAVADKGGVVGIAFVPEFLGGEANAARIAAHVKHAVQVAGLDHVGIGSDFDGSDMPAGIEGLQSLPLVWQALRQCGFSEDEVDKIAGGNFCRLLAEVLP